MTNEPGQTSLAWWFPRVQATGVRVPRTRLLKAGGWLTDLLEGLTPQINTFVRDLELAVTEIGGPPAFIRTGYGSGKHEWKHTCHYTGERPLMHHVAALVEWSLVVDPIGLPLDDWAVREFLPVKPEITLARYSGMPLNRERRWFIQDGRPVWFHPYWPEDICDDGDEQMLAALRRLNAVDMDEARELHELSARVAGALPGAWSVDWLHVPEVGWYMIDAAPAAISWKDKHYRPDEQIAATLGLVSLP